MRHSFCSLRTLEVPCDYAGSGLHNFSSFSRKVKDELGEVHCLLWNMFCASSIPVVRLLQTVEYPLT